MFLSKAMEIGPGTWQFAAGMAISTFIFLVYAVGVHVAQTGYLALATDLVPQRDRHSAVALLWVALIVGQIISALIISWYLIDYTPVRLIQIMQTASVIFLALAIVSIYGQDPFGKIEGNEEASLPRIRAVLSQRRNQIFFAIVFLGTLAINGQDVLLEPYGGQVLGMSVHETTRLSALLGGGMLLAMALATWLYRRLASPLYLALLAMAVSLLGFTCIIGASAWNSVQALSAGAAVLGLANGLFLISTLSIVLTMADKNTAGLYVGVWGLVQTTAIGVGTLVGGLTRDAAMRASDNVSTGYTTFYSLELALAVLTGVLLLVLLRASVPARQPQHSSVFAGLSDIPGG
jgi:BCD family chlorophyll transporter-like MFS transporter